MQNVVYISTFTTRTIGCVEQKTYSIRAVMHRRALKFLEPYTDTVMSESLFLL